MEPVFLKPVVLKPVVKPVVVKTSAASSSSASASVTVLVDCRDLATAKSKKFRVKVDCYLLGKV